MRKLSAQGLRKIVLEAWTSLKTPMTDREERELGPEEDFDEEQQFYGNQENITSAAEFGDDVDPDDEGLDQEYFDGYHDSYYADELETQEMVPELDSDKFDVDAEKIDSDVDDRVLELAGIKEARHRSK